MDELGGITSEEAMRNLDANLPALREALTKRPGLMRWITHEPTDREALEQLLARFGLEQATSGGAEQWAQLGAVCLAAGQGEVEGYDGFLTVFQFDADGKFQSVNLWE